MAQCQTCKGIGQVCDECRQPDGECTCDDGPEVVDCDECDGTGEVD